LTLFAIPLQVFGLSHFPFAVLHFPLPSGAKTKVQVHVFLPTLTFWSTYCLRGIFSILDAAGPITNVPCSTISVPRSTNRKSGMHSQPGMYPSIVVSILPVASSSGTTSLGQTFAMPDGQLIVVSLTGQTLVKP